MGSRHKEERSGRKYKKHRHSGKSKSSDEDEVDRKPKRCKTEEEFVFETYKQDINPVLNRFKLIVDLVDFWKFVRKYQTMKRVPSVDVNSIICIQFKFTVDEFLKRVTSRALTAERITELLNIVKVYLNFKQVERFNKLQKLRKSQLELPVAAHEKDIVEAVQQGNVVIVAGDTGCGKSTQVPQFLLRAGFEKIACTQPRRLACIALCSRLKFETLNQYNEYVGYQIRFERRKNRDTKVLFLTEGLLLRQVAADSSLSEYSVIILDEVHERHVQSDLLLGLLKCLLVKRPDLKLVLMSATININLFDEYFQGQAKVIRVPGRLFPVDVRYRPVPAIDEWRSRMKIDPGPYLQILQMIDEKHKREKGDVLIFLSGTAEISNLVEAITQYNEKQGTWIVLPLHSSLSLAEQDKVFDYAPEGYRKCIVSTNIAETSVTIDGIRFVIDSGKVKEMSFDSVSKMERLKEFWISRSSAEQRKGRAGRTGPGTCYRIFSEEDYAQMEEYTTPEIRRTPLDTVLLQLVAMGLPDVRKFPFLEAPMPEDIENCVLSLKQHEALTEEERITEVGKTLTNLPVDITIGKMLITACVLGLAESGIVLAAALSVQSPMTSKAYRDIDAETARKEDESDHGDPLSIVGLFRAWVAMKDAQEDSRRWCRRRGLEEQRFYEMTKLRHQFTEILTEAGLLQLAESRPPTSAERRIRQGEVKLLRKMRKESNKPSGRKYLKPDVFKVEEERDGDEVDVKDIEFRLRNDRSKVRQLLRDVDVTSHTAMTLLKIVFCSGLYPQFAVADEFNVRKSEQVFHTKTKPSVFLHPVSYFGLHPSHLKLEEPDIVKPPGIKYDGKIFSAKHQVLCYLSLLETNKIYLTNMLRMPALQSFLFFANSIDASFDLSKMVCDGWVLFEVLNPRQAEVLVMKLVKLRKKWHTAVEAKLAKTDASVDVRKLAGELVDFLHLEVVYSMRRLLPADLKYLHGSGMDFELTDNPFDKDFVPQRNFTKGGFQVAPYLTYNAVAGSDTSADAFECSNCNLTFQFNTFQRIQHRENCTVAKKESVDEEEKPNSSKFHCENCDQYFFFTSIQVLKHKKVCRPK